MLRGFSGRPYYSQEGTTGSPKAVEPSPQTEPGSGQQPAANNGGDEKRFTQADVDAIVKDRLDREKRKTEEAAERARKAAEQKALEEQGNWKQIAEQHQAEVAKLQSEIEAGKQTSKDLDRYRSALKQHVEAQRKDLPDHIKKLLEKLDEVEQLTWLTENREALNKPEQQRLGTPARREAPKPQQQPAEQPKRRINF